MASAPDPNALPWWMGPTESPTDSLFKGVQAGAALASTYFRGRQVAIEEQSNIRRQEAATQFKMLEYAQQGERDKNALNLKMMDLSMEQQRNDIAIRAEKHKQERDIAQSKGMLEMGDYMANAVRNNKLTDPETIAGWHQLTSRLAPFVPDTVVNSWYDNTFKPALDRKAMADRYADGMGNTPASVAEFKFREDLRKRIDTEADPARKQQLIDDLKSYEAKAGFTKGDPFAIETVTGPSGRDYEVLRSPNGSGKLLPVVDAGKLSNLDAETYRAELKGLQEDWKNMDQKFIKDGKPDSGLYSRARQLLYDKFEAKAKAGPSSGSGGDTAPARGATIMRDKNGNSVRVPAGRVDEMRAKGYQ